MPKSEIDKFFAKVEEPKRSTLEEMRSRILEVVPGAEQTIKYGMPAFLKDGWCFVCIAPFKNHINWSPYSSNVFVQLQDELAGYAVSKGSMQFAVDKPLPKTLVKRLIRVRLAEIELQKAAKLAKKAASRKQKP
jgi:uncharacterized protein YdhG (YjbR/CyaY superfamily)